MAGCVTELIQAAEAMKGRSNLSRGGRGRGTGDLAYVSSAGTEWVDPEDPTVIAENELLGAAAAIEAAAKKLEQLRPRTKPKVRAP